MFSISRRSMVSASITDTVPGVSFTVDGLSVALTVTVSKKRCGLSGSLSGGAGGWAAASCGFGWAGASGAWG